MGLSENPIIKASFVAFLKFTKVLKWLKANKDLHLCLFFFFGLSCTFTDATCPQVFPLPTVPKISGRKLGEAIYYLKEQVTVSYATATEVVTLQVRNKAGLKNSLKMYIVSPPFMTNDTERHATTWCKGQKSLRISGWFWCGGRTLSIKFHVKVKLLK